jgi:hypothetical protein
MISIAHDRPVCACSEILVVIADGRPSEGHWECGVGVSDQYSISAALFKKVPDDKVVGGLVRGIRTPPELF